MAITEECRSITDVLQDAISKESEVEHYMAHCADEVGNARVREYLQKLAHEEADHRHKLEEYLDEVKAQIEIDEAIMESYDHF